MPLLEDVRGDDRPAGHQVVMLQDTHPLDAAGGRQDHDGQRTASMARGYGSAPVDLAFRSVQGHCGSAWERIVVPPGASSCSVRAVCHYSVSGGGRISMDAARRSSVALSRPSSEVSLRSSSDTGILMSSCMRTNRARQTVLAPPGKPAFSSG